MPQDQAQIRPRSIAIGLLAALMTGGLVIHRSSTRPDSDPRILWNTETKRPTPSIPKLREALREQQLRSEQARDALLPLIRKHHPLPRFDDADGGLPPHMLPASLTAEVIELQTILEALRSSAGEARFTFAAEIPLPDNLLQPLLHEWHASCQRLADARRPETQTTAAELSRLQHEETALRHALHEGTDQIVATLEAQLEMVKEQLARLTTEEQMPEEAASAITIARENYTNAEARRNAMHLRLIRTEIRQRDSD